MNCSADQPSSSPSPKRSSIERAVRAHADRVDHRRHEATDRVGIGEPGALAAVQIDRGEHTPRHIGPGADRGNLGGMRQEMPPATCLALSHRAAPLPHVSVPTREVADHAGEHAATLSHGREVIGVRTDGELRVRQRPVERHHQIEGIHLIAVTREHQGRRFDPADSVRREPLVVEPHRRRLPNERAPLLVAAGVPQLS